MTTDESMDMALRKAGEFLVNKTKEKLTTNGSVDTGVLRNSITYEVNGDELEVFAPVVYGIWVEFGTGLFAANGDGRQDVPWRYQTPDGEWHTTSGSRPKPFFYNTYTENQDKVKKILTEGIKEALK